MVKMVDSEDACSVKRLSVNIRRTRYRAGRDTINYDDRANWHEPRRAPWRHTVPPVVPNHGSPT